LRRGIVFIYLLGLSIGISFANGSSDIDPLGKTSKSKDVEVPQIESDSTDAPEEDQPYDVEPELGSLNSYSELSDLEEQPVEVVENDTYYEREEESDESSNSLISFNFLYYLLQKFKFSNSLGY
jgi:hypothetical protein